MVSANGQVKIDRLSWILGPCNVNGNEIADELAATVGFYVNV